MDTPPGMRKRTVSIVDEDDDLQYVFNDIADLDDRVNNQARCFANHHDWLTLLDDHQVRHANEITNLTARLDIVTGVLNRVITTIMDGDPGYASCLGLSAPSAPAPQAAGPRAARAPGAPEPRRGSCSP